MLQEPRVFPAPMAVADGVVAPPPPPPPPATLAFLALARSRLARVAADAVICLGLASIWFLVAGAAALDIRRRACGEGCRVVAAASRFIHAAMLSCVVVGPFALLLCVSRVVESDTEAGKVFPFENVEHPEAPAPLNLAAAARRVVRDVVMLGIFASLPFGMLLVIGEMLKGNPPVKGSRRERTGSVISDVGAMGMYVLFFFIVIPT